MNAKEQARFDEQYARRVQAEEKWRKLREEKRELTDVIALAEQLQDEVERLEGFVKMGGWEQVARQHQGSRSALAIRYGRLHRALRDIADTSLDGESCRLAEEALAEVDDKAWLRARLAEKNGSLG